MDIIKNVWYRFESPLDKAKWIDLVSLYLGIPKRIEWVKAVALKLGPRGVNYRSSFYGPNFPEEGAEVWKICQGPCKVIEFKEEGLAQKAAMNSKFGIKGFTGKRAEVIITDDLGTIDNKVMEEYKMENNKVMEGYKMENNKSYLQRALDLIRRVRSKREEEQTIALVEARNKFIKTTEVGKLAIKMAETINSINEEAKVSWESFFNPNYLPEEERKKLMDLNSIKCKEDVEFEEMCQEAQTLLAMCDNFQEAQEILKKYGFIIGPKE